MRKVFLALAAAVCLVSCSAPMKKGYDNMALLYGGNMQRNPCNWTKERLASHVSYTDSTGKEQWLFDAFLALEIWDKRPEGTWTYGLGFKNPAGDRQSWQHFIDWWFAKDNGFDALDQAVAEAASRIGKPAYPRKVVVSIPDAIPHAMFNDTTSTSVFWGELDGRALDFSKGEDRVAACSWFVDEVCRRWKAAGYKNITLEGFYCFSEELATPGNGWSYELKKWDQVYPAVSDYVHSLGYTMSWIPYRYGAGFDRWQSFGFDYAQMQPNYLWHPEFSMDEWMQKVREAGISMELELDDSLREGRKEGWESARERFYYYMEMARMLGFVGTHEFSYYMGSDTLNNLKNSESELDRQLYKDFCEFVLSTRRSR